MRQCTVAYVLQLIVLQLEGHKFAINLTAAVQQCAVAVQRVVIARQGAAAQQVCWQMLLVSVMCFYML